jgi:hypothetical protein
LVWLLFLQDFKHEQGTDNLFFLVFALLLALFVRDNIIQCLHELELVLRRRQVSEVCKRLDPKVAGVLRILDCRVFAYFHHHLLVIVLNVIVQQLLLESKFLAANLYSVRVIVNLEQEQNIIFVDLFLVLANKSLNLFLETLWLGLELVNDCSLVHLLRIKKIFQQAMVQVNCRQLLKLLRIFDSDLIYHKLEELLDKFQIVDKDLKKVLNPNLLMLLQSILFFVLRQFKLFVVLRIVHQSQRDVFDDLKDPLLLALLLRNCLAINSFSNIL